MLSGVHAKKKILGGHFHLEGVGYEYTCQSNITYIIIYYK